MHFAPRLFYVAAQNFNCRQGPNIRSTVLENRVNKRIPPIAGMAALLVAGIAIGQGRIMDEVVNKVLTKYQTSSCEQLWAAKGQPQSPREQQAVQFLRNDATARTEFLNKVAGPIANKLFECGMIP
jgi:hypothetical protein